MSDMLYDHEKAVLQKARETYGDKNQILVCMEELNELACVLAKYPRYADGNKATEELHSKILDEYADVLIILEHVKSIAKLSDTEIRQRICAKVDRLERWLTHSSSMQETIEDREVPEFSMRKHPCETCIRRKDRTDKTYDNYCRPCYMAQATEGKAPYYMGECK